MERFIYATSFGLIMVFAEYVAVLRQDDFTMWGCLAIAVVALLLTIASLLEERSYVAKRTVHTVVLFGTDFNHPKDNKGYHFGL